MSRPPRLNGTDNLTPIFNVIGAGERREREKRMFGTAPVARDSSLCSE